MHPTIQVRPYKENGGLHDVKPDLCFSIEGEYIPLPGDEVKYRLCPIPPKYEKNQAINVHIINLTPEVHLRWDCPVSEEETESHGH